MPGRHEKNCKCRNCRFVRGERIGMKKRISVALNLGVMALIRKIAAERQCSQATVIENAVRNSYEKEVIE